MIKRIKKQLLYGTIFTGSGFNGFIGIFNANNTRIVVACYCNGNIALF